MLCLIDMSGPVRGLTDPNYRPDISYARDILYLSLGSHVEILVEERMNIEKRA